MILVGMDFSDDAWEALAEARDLSRSTGMPVEVLFVNEESQEDGWTPSPDQMYAMDASALPWKALKVRQGVPWFELVRYARERGARLIVAGRRGASDFQPFALGATAHRLATIARDPVLLVSKAGKRSTTTVPEGQGEPSSPRGQAQEKHGLSTQSEAS